MATDSPSNTRRSKLEPLVQRIHPPALVIEQETSQSDPPDLPDPPTNDLLEAMVRRIVREELNRQKKYSLRDAINLLDVGGDTIRRWVSEGALVSHKRERGVYFKKHELEAAKEFKTKRRSPRRKPTTLPTPTPPAANG